MSNDKTRRIAEMFEEGKRFTEEVMHENERLRLVNAKLQRELGGCRSDTATRDVLRLKERVRLLEQDNHLLKEELHELRDQYAAVAKESRDFSERYLCVEQQSATLLSLYVAEQRLSSAMELREAVAVLEEIIVNLVGSEQFAVYLLDVPGGRLVPLACEGSSERSSRPIDPLVAQVVASGVAYLREPGTAATGAPVACVPLKLGAWVLGVAVIHELLAQKPGLEATDLELIELLAERAAAAMCAAHLLSRAGALEPEGRARLAVELVREAVAAG